MDRTCRKMAETVLMQFTLLIWEQRKPACAIQGYPYDKTENQYKAVHDLCGFNDFVYRDRCGYFL